MGFHAVYPQASRKVVLSFHQLGERDEASGSVERQGTSLEFLHALTMANRRKYLWLFLQWIRVQ